MNVSGLPLERIGILTGLHTRSDLAVAASDQTHEFLRRGYIAAKFAALLRHGTTNAHGMTLLRILLALCLQGRVDPQFGRAVAPRQIFNHRLAGFAGRGFIANTNVVIAHDCYPLLRRGHNAHARGKLHGVRLSRPDGWFGSPPFPSASGYLGRKTLRTRRLASNRHCPDPRPASPAGPRFA